MAIDTNGIHFLNNHFDVDVSGWVIYNDNAAVPVDGIGGTVSTTFTSSTVSPLAGPGSGVLTKAGVSELGEGISYNFTVDPSARNKPIKLDFSYTTSASYVNGDIGVYVLDVTNNILLYPSIVNIPNSGVANAFFEASLYLNANSGSYRLMFHIQTANATAYTFKLDEINIEPMIPASGAVISEWREYTPTMSATSVVPSLVGFTSNGYWRRAGSNAEIRMNVKWTSSTAGSGSYIFSLPPGLSINTSSKTFISADSNVHCPIGSANISSTTIGGGFKADVGWQNNVSLPTNAVALVIPGVAASNPSNITTLWGWWGSGSAVNASNTAGVSMAFSVPIAQWSANTNLVEDFTEYAYNTSTTTASDTNSFGYGPEGAFIQAFAPAGTASIEKRVRFKRPIQIQDRLVFEIHNTSTPNNGWVEPSFLMASSNDNFTIRWGVELVILSGGTDIAVYFYSQAYPTGAWSLFGNYSWRVRKISNGNMAESLPAVSTYNAGVSYRQGDLVYSSSSVYFSLLSGNIGNTPASSPTYWSKIGADSNLTVNTLKITSTQDVDLTGVTGGLNIGDTTGVHLSIDNNEIMVKDTPTTAGTLHLQANGGSVSIGAPTAIASTLSCTALTETSSIKLKENISNIEGALDNLVKLQGVVYNRIGKDELEAGLIAEEVDKVLPILVSKDRNGEAVGIHYTKITAYIIEAIKELKKEIDEIKGHYGSIN